MATSISCGYAMLMDGGTYSGILWRTFAVAGSWFSTGTAQAYGGVIPCGGALEVSAGTGMTVDVATGFIVIPSSSGNLYGAYQFGLMSAGSLTVATADPTNPRTDLVCATVTDNGDDTSGSEIQIITGTPASSPAVPQLPADSVALAYVTVPALATSITSGDISDQRVFTTTVGGVIPVQALSDVPPGYTGQYAHDLTTGRLVHNPASGPAQPHVLPYAPVIAASTSSVANSGSETTILSLTFTSDGVADWEFTARWSGIFVSSGGGQSMTAVLRLELDGTQIAVFDAYNPANDGTPRGGGTLWHVTSGTVGDTPSAGSHTLKFRFTQIYSGSLNVEVYGGTSQPILLYARPATL